MSTGKEKLMLGITKQGQPYTHEPVYIHLKKKNELEAGIENAFDDGSNARVRPILVAYEKVKLNWRKKK